jgi:nucleoside-diphosphate-sugar epimerase
MKILIVGASGRVGTLLAQQLLKLGHQITGTSRHSKPLFDLPNYKHLQLDITQELAQLEARIADDFDAVYCVAGSGSDQGLLQTDLHGAIKIMQIAEKKGINRFIHVSFGFSLEPEKWKEEGLEELTDYGIAKHYADLWLIKNTNLNYTLLQPCWLTETPGSGKITVNIKHHGSNSIENVANTLVAVLDNIKTYQKVISMHDGDVPIREAIDSL